MDKNKVLLAMSGGTDSSTAAMLLIEKGYDVIGVTMRMWDLESHKEEKGQPQYIKDAKDVAERLGFEHYVLDVRDRFKETVINNFVDEYMSGRTPNPCVLCNVVIKWDFLLQLADKYGCDKIATGHYAKISYKNGRYFITKGEDNKKDQSYFLWGLPQDVLKRAMFPLGEFTKDKIREYAESKGFTRIAEKKDSMEICFIEDNEYRNFLRKQINDIDNNPGEGDFVLKDGTKVGKHKGYPFYTIGQRKGLGIALGKPAYVVEIDAESNTIILGDKEDLNSKVVWVKEPNIMMYENLPEKLEVTAKIRYKNTGTAGEISREGEYIKLELFDNVSAVTPGQSAVFYDGEHVIGGGIITSEI